MARRPKRQTPAQHAQQRIINTQHAISIPVTHTNSEAFDDVVVPNSLSPPLSPTEDIEASDQENLQENAQQRDHRKQQYQRLTPIQREVKKLRTEFRKIKLQKMDTQKEKAQSLIISIIVRLFNKTPKNEQIECIFRLAIEEKDTILVAKTGFGKSMVMQAVSLLIPESVTLVILPLNEIANDQERVITEVGGFVLVLNSDTPNRIKRIEEARIGKYTHIILSPELAISNELRKLFTDSVFRQKLALIAVDEGHLVRTWGEDFREAYQQLGHVRSLLHDSAPWFTCSATLDKDTMDDVIDSMGFKRRKDLVIRTPITRKEIAFQCGYICKGTKKKFTSLRFLFDDAIYPPIDSENTYIYVDKKTLDCHSITPEKIPKTIVFVNGREDAANSRYAMNEYLQMLHPTKYTLSIVEGVTATFHRRVSFMKKKEILDEFRKPDSKIRVLFATEALGIGVDIPDVRRVVIYGFPAPKKDLGIALQRGGRAARDGKPGVCIFLFEEWAQGPRIINPPVHRQVNRHGGRRQVPKPMPLPGSNKEDASKDDTMSEGDAASEGDSETEDNITSEAAANRRADLPIPFYRLSNRDGCMREIIYDYFQESAEDRHLNTDQSRCCGVCNASLELSDLRRDVFQERGPALTAKKKAVLERLTTWIETEGWDLVIPPDTEVPRIPEIVIPYNMLKTVALYSDKIDTYNNLLQYISDWEYKDELSKLLFKVVQQVV